MDLNGEQTNNEVDTIEKETSFDELLKDKTIDELKELKKEILNGSLELEDSTENSIRF